jgi:hypothetical protein
LLCLGGSRGKTRRTMKKLPVILLAASLAALTACDRPASETVELPGDKERLKAAADAAARTAQAVTQKLGETYGTNQAINVHVQVGDIVVLGFDEGIDAEEWGMTEISNEGAAPAATGAKNAAIQADQASATAGKRKIARSIDLRKGSIYLVAAEESEAVAEEVAVQEPAIPAAPAGQ